MPERPSIGALPTHYPFSLGAYLAINAVRDAAVVVDGPACVALKAEVVHGNHDWCSTLLGTPLHPRVLYTGANAESVIFDRTASLLAFLSAVASRPDVGVVLVLGSPVSQLTGIQYDLLTRRLAGTTRVPVTEIADASLDTDWLDGYDETLVALSRVTISPVPPEPGTAAIVGLMTDRTEGDAVGNAIEVRRLVEGATGLRVVSAWPDGGGVSGLARASVAEVVISLPYGRRAARAIAATTGATLIEAPLPVGFDATRSFVECLADGLGARRLADTLIRRELAEAVRCLRPFGVRLFADSFGAWLGDPYLAPGATALMADLGCRIEVVAASTREAHDGPDSRPHGACTWSMQWAPDLASFADAIVDARRHASRFFGVVPLHLELPRRLAPLPCVVSELGFPSIGTHSVGERPYYGFRGVATLVERLGGLS